MISLKTQIAIAVLSDIYAGGTNDRTIAFKPSELLLNELFDEFSKAGIIHSIDASNPLLLSSYQPIKASCEVSLLDILEVTDEHLNCNHPTTEAFYARYARAAPKLGVVNQMTRLYLQNIKLFDL